MTGICRNWIPAATSVALALLTGCSEQRELSPLELQALFADKTVEGYHDVYKYKFRSYYDPAGTFRSYQDSSGRAQTAKWWVKGKAICIRWDGQATELCRAVVAKGGRYRKVARIGGRTTTVVRFSRFRDGNPDHL